MSLETTPENNNHHLFLHGEWVEGETIHQNLVVQFFEPVPKPVAIN
jgi:hypothetical protein